MTSSLVYSDGVHLLFLSTSQRPPWRRARSSRRSPGSGWSCSGRRAWAAAWSPRRRACQTWRCPRSGRPWPCGRRAPHARHTWHGYSRASGGEAHAWHPGRSPSCSGRWGAHGASHRAGRVEAWRCTTTWTRRGPWTLLRGCTYGRQDGWTDPGGSGC